MIASSVWTNLVTTLQNNPTLSAYIKYVFQRRRYDVSGDSFPCIMLEPVRNNEIDKDLNQIKDLFLTINIFAFSTPAENDFSKAVVGDENYKGILDIENDIRACLQSSYTLGDTVIDVRFEPTEFGSPELGDKYPILGMLMPIKILYRQINGA